MSNKKHIDRLFQEKLKGLESTPSLSVWENISKEIHTDKKRRKIIPIWRKIAGIAASLFLLFSLGNLLLNKDMDIIPSENVVTKSKDDKTTQEKLNQSDANSLDNVNNENVASQELKQEDSSKSNKALNPVVKNNIDKKNTVASQQIEVNNTQKTNKKLLINKKELDNNVNNSIAQTELISNSPEGKEKTFDKGDVTNLSLKKELDEINGSKTTDVAVVVDNKKQMTKNASENKINEGEKLSLIDALVSDNESKKDELEKNHKWRVSTNIAPVYFNTLGSGSSMDVEFVNNTKSGDINMSYGISASYTINDKFDVRVGVNKVKLGYNTHDVFHNNSNSISSIATKGVEIDKDPAELTSVTVSGMRFSQVPEPLSNQFEASINQELGFVEIPLEIQYKISNTKFGVNLIGGFSALFLYNNEIFSTLNDNSILIGKATNINNLSYSANLGLGLDYKISKKVNLNLEPVFKYQLNTFNNTSGNFKPYFIGVYTGFSFKF